MRKDKYHHPGPVFDEFLKAFIATRNNESFYVDLNGHFDFNFRKIQWGNKVLKIEVANPYLIGYLLNNIIELRSIFNPNRIVQKIELDECHFITTCVSQNMINRSYLRLDDFYVVINFQDYKQVNKNKKQLDEKYRLIKFKQGSASHQFAHWCEMKLFTTCLKFVDFLDDFHLKCGIDS